MNGLIDGADRVYWWLRQRPPVAAGLAAVLVALIAGLLLLGGGDEEDGGIPASAVATVGGSPISKADLTRWQAVYTKVAASGGTAKPTAAQARQSAFELLAGSKWITEEAARQDVKATPTEVKRATDTYLKSAAESAKVTRATVLQQLGTSYADLQFQQRIALLAQRLQEKIVAAIPKPTSAAIAKSYADEPARWAKPSQRDVEAIITTSKNDADAAYAALKEGTTFGTVAEQYQANQALAGSGGKLTGLKPGTTDPAIERPIFAAPVNELQEPVPVGEGAYLVLKVTKVSPLPEQTLQQARTAIARSLSAAAATEATSAFLTDLSKRWKPQTKCAAGYRSEQYCGSTA